MLKIPRYTRKIVFTRKLYFYQHNKYLKKIIAYFYEKMQESYSYLNVMIRRVREPQTHPIIEVRIKTAFQNSGSDQMMLNYLIINSNCQYMRPEARMSVRLGGKAQNQRPVLAPLTRLRGGGARNLSWQLFALFRAFN